MQRIESLAIGALVLTVFYAPPATSSVHPARMPGEWHQVATAEVRTPAGDASLRWSTEDGASKLESRLERDAGDRTDTHRVLFTWSELPASLAAGEPVDFGSVALVEDSEGLGAEGSVSVSCWTSVSSVPEERVPARAVRVTSAAVTASDPAGTIARAQARWYAPEGPDGDALSTGALHVRVTVTHGGNAVSYTRSYSWIPVTATTD